MDASKKVSQSNHFDSVLKEAMADPSRRQILRGGLGLSALSFLGLAGCAGGTDSDTPDLKPALNFSSAPLNQTYDGVSVPEGYQVNILYKLGDPINTSTLAYSNKGTEAFASFDYRSGDHHDGMYFFGMGANGKWDESVSDKGILCINHEAITPLFLHANGGPTVDGSKIRTSSDEVQKEFRLHGVSVIEVNKTSDGKFTVNKNSTFNKRITTLTDMDISGPLKGNDLLKTKYSPNGEKTRGTVNNCASGYTPWGTYLTCEENYANYFKRANTTGRTANDKASEARNSVTSTSGREGWTQVGGGDEYARWDITITGASATDDFRNAAYTFGFNVEIDPFAPTSTPKKRTAMGRFAHEGAWVAPVTAGKPVVFYMGCDSEDEYIYKFVSTALWSQSDVNGGLAAGDKYLDAGKLYVAKFNSNFTGEWLELTTGLNGEIQLVGSETYTFSAVDPYLNTRIAADKKGATQMDRPEWGAVNPANGEVYFTLTNARSKRPVIETDAANPRSYTDNSSGTGNTAGNWNGHIIRWRENNSNPAATAFDWDIYVFGAETDDLNNANVNLSGLTADNFLSSPDGLWFSKKTGIMYIQTDDGQFTNESNGSGSTCMLLAAIPGQVGDGSSVSVTNSVGGVSQTVTTRVGKVGQLKRLLTGPIDCEITGITETYDGKALFINIQHPGENTKAENLATPTSSWPYSDTGSGNPATANTAKSARPRSATIVLTRKDGGVVGTTGFTLS